MSVLILRKTVFCFVCLNITLCSSLAKAEIVADETLPSRTLVSPAGCSVCEVTGGSLKGSNLFHSFTTFSVDDEVYFDNSLAVENIFSRVTGDSFSDINGVIRANGAANLFLLNPNGIIFGEEASLEIGGAFTATTAERILFEENVAFDVFSSPSNALLSVGVPIGLQFGQSPGSITNASISNLSLDDNGIPLSGGLTVAEGKTIALIGRGINIEGGLIFSPNGDIELSSVESNSTVRTSLEGDQLDFFYDAISDSAGDINFFNFSYLNTDGSGAGSIHIRGDDISLTEGSLIRAVTTGDEPGGDISVVASGDVLLSGDFTAFEVWSEGSGSASNIAINASRLTIEEGAYLDSQGLVGEAGNILITVDNLEISGVDSEGVSGGIFAEAYEDYDSGLSGGDVVIDADTLAVKDGAQIALVTFGSASAGNLSLEATESVLIEDATDNQGRTGLFNQVAVGLDEDGNDILSSGNAGSITVITDSLIARGGGKIENNTFAAGNAGNTVIMASDVVLDGSSPDGAFASAISAEVSSEEATGNGGTLTIQSESLTVLNGAQISTAALGEGRGGILDITASEAIVLNGILAEGNLASNSSGIFASAEAGSSNSGGTLNVSTDTLVVEEGAKISADNFGSGEGSTATINARRVLIQSGGRVGSGSLLDVGVDPDRLGNGGSLTVNASESIEISGRKVVGEDVIDSELFTRAEGAGSAGTLTINSTSEGNLAVVVSEGAEISASTVSSTGGNIILNNPNAVLLRSGGRITAEAGSAQNAGDGGNVTFVMPDGFVLAVPGEDSDIVANAFLGDGGNIDITARNIIGLEQRQASLNNNTNDIDASSQFGTSGTVAINNLEFDPTQGLIELPANTASPNQVAQRCLADSDRQSTFLITGQGGTPPAPGDIVQQGTLGLIDLGESPASNSATTSNVAAFYAATDRPSDELIAKPITEAQGWGRDVSGQVVLVSEAQAQPTNNASYFLCAQARQ